MIKKILEDTENLNEMAIVFKSREYSILIAVNPDSHRQGDPYFKFLNNSNYQRATKIIRILFNRCDYVIHNDGKELWHLSNKDKKLLIEILNKRSTKYKDYTNWEAAKFDWNLEYLEEMLDIDEYYKGNYDDKYRDDKGYIISTLKMPDYMNL